MSKLTASLPLAAFLHCSAHYLNTRPSTTYTFQTAYFSGLVVPGAQSFVFEDFQLVRGRQQRASSCGHTRYQGSGHFESTSAAA